MNTRFPRGSEAERYWMRWCGAPARYSWNEADHPRDDDGRFAPRGGAAFTKAQVSKAGEAIRSKLEAIKNAPNASLRTSQYLGTVADYMPDADLPEKTKRAHVFFDPAIGHAAAFTEGRTIRVGMGALDDMGSSGSLGDTFAHEVEHLIDEHEGRKRQEYTPRLRQMLRELEDEPSPAQFLIKKEGRGDDNARFHVGGWFARHPGHELSDADIQHAVEEVKKKAMELVQKQYAT